LCPRPRATTGTSPAARSNVSTSATEPGRSTATGRRCTMCPKSSATSASASSAVVNRPSQARPANSASEDISGRLLDQVGQECLDGVSQLVAVDGADRGTAAVVVRGQRDDDVLVVVADQ